MSVDGPKLRKTFARAMPVGVLVALLAGAVWMLWPASNRRTVDLPTSAQPRPVMSDGLALKPVDLPVALLFDCYENALENVPPRTDTSKRQWSWEAPPLPMNVARRELGKAGASDNDRKMLAWLENWEAGWKKDYPTTTDQLWGLDALLKETKLSFELLFEIGLGMSFLDGDEHAEVWQAMAVVEAHATVRGGAFVGKDADRCLKYLGQTRALWRRENYQALQRRFSIEQALLPKGSKEQRKSGFLVAEILYREGLANSAADAAVAAEKEDRLAGDLRETDWEELHWVLGACLFHAGRYSEALPYMRAAARSAGPRAEQILPILALALVRTGKLQEAANLYNRLRVQQPNSDLLPMLEAELTARNESRFRHVRYSRESR